MARLCGCGSEGKLEGSHPHHCEPWKVQKMRTWCIKHLWWALDWGMKKWPQQEVRSKPLHREVLSSCQVPRGAWGQWGPAQWCVGGNWDVPSSATPAPRNPA